MMKSEKLRQDYEAMWNAAKMQPGLVDLVQAYNAQSDVMKVYAVAANTIGQVSQAINSVSARTGA